MAKKAGFATSVLLDVDHTDCPDVGEMGGPFGSKSKSGRVTRRLEAGTVSIAQ
jgi:hypothetical protein